MEKKRRPELWFPMTSLRVVMERISVVPFIRSLTGESCPFLRPYPAFNCPEQFDWGVLSWEHLFLMQTNIESLCPRNKTLLVYLREDFQNFGGDISWWDLLAISHNYSKNTQIDPIKREIEKAGTVTNVVCHMSSPFAGKSTMAIYEQFLKVQLFSKKKTLDAGSE